MKQNNEKGFFIAVDAQENMKKDRIVQLLYERLISDKKHVYITEEPTQSGMGKLIRENTGDISGYALACLMAADRYVHIRNEIIPHLKEVGVVITNQYILSSLVRQEEDAIKEQYTVEVNHNILKPDLQVVIMDRPVNMEERLMTRDKLLEIREANAEQENYINTLRAAQILEQLNIPVAYMNGNESDEELVDKIIALLPC